MKILRSLLTTVVVISFFTAPSRAMQQSSKGGFDISVRSFWTNYSVPATVTARSAQGGQARTFRTDDFGRLHIDVPTGEYVFDVSALGYEPSEGARLATASGHSQVVFVLHPRQEPEEVGALPRLFRAGFAVVTGWVVDAASGKPLPGVRIRVDGGRAEEVTNDRGYFALSVPAPTPRTNQGVEMPGTGTVIAQLPNYKTFIAKNVMLPDGMDAPMNIELERGLGSIEQDHCHKLDTGCQQNQGPTQ